MNVFGKIMSKIFGKKDSAAPTTAAPSPASTPAASGSAALNNTVNTTVTTASSTGPVDVEAVLERMAAESKQKLNWRTSIVDLMKLVGMESSLAERRELADELGYTGDKQDTATMNMWLHKQVLKKLAENGGTVPADLLD